MDEDGRKFFDLLPTLLNDGGGKFLTVQVVNSYRHIHTMHTPSRDFNLTLFYCRIPAIILPHAVVGDNARWFSDPRLSRFSAALFAPDASWYSGCNDTQTDKFSMM